MDLTGPGLSPPEYPTPDDENDASTGARERFASQFASYVSRSTFFTLQFLMAGTYIATDV
jgi:hypothetical protein